MKNIRNHALHRLLVVLAISAVSTGTTHTKVAQKNLQNAIAHNNAQGVKNALQAGADIHAKNAGGSTPLLVATSDDSPLVQLLLSYGAQNDINIPNTFGLTPFMAAVRKNNLPLVELLLSYGGSFEGSSQSDITNAVRRSTPEIHTLLSIAGVIDTPHIGIATIVHNLSDEERARALRVMDARLREPRSFKDLQLLAALGDARALERLEKR